MAQALDYRERITAAIPADSCFKPLMTLYLTDSTPPEVMYTPVFLAAHAAVSPICCAVIWLLPCETSETRCWTPSGGQRGQGGGCGGIQAVPCWRHHQLSIRRDRHTARDPHAPCDGRGEPSASPGHADCPSPAQARHAYMCCCVSVPRHPDDHRWMASVDHVITCRID
jgi:hypothetical protein